MVLRLTSSVAVLLVVFGAIVFGAADRARGDNIYYVGTNNGVAWSFGTVDSAGNKTPIATGLRLGGAGAEKLMFAPDGTLYGFDVGYAGGSGAWGRINPATGAFTQIGSLTTSFYDGSVSPHNETNGFSLAFGPSGNLYVAGYDPYDSGGNYDYGTLSLTTGAFTKLGASPLPYAGSLAAPIPEPSTLALLGLGAVSLLAYRWRWHRMTEGT